ncbi:glycosyltransferase [Pararhizobium haloflavum]|uniref:glycosyltransferase n=1 Tax=Pararhizobium haloflavum TaxID=2037914 RepID=UPI000C17C350|nr:glycosyltransferase [Pararhizobium haloflavum]
MPEKSLRIIHCFRSPVGGIFRHVRDLAAEHSAAGHQVGIICDSTTGGSYEDALFDAIRPHLALGLTRLPIGRSIAPSDVRAALASYREIKNLQPDILHGHGAKGGAYARIVGSRLRVSRYRVARFYSPHGGSLHYDAARPSGRFFFAIERMMERMTDQLVFVSEHERQTYLDKVGRPRCAEMLVYNGLDSGEFVPVALHREAADFLYIGMMRDLKGPDVFIRAFQQAERLAGRPFKGVMVGDGDDKPRYAAMLKDLGLDDRISLHAAMKARDAFAMARNVVIPSRAEAMPYIVLEAIAGGKPVIASRVGGIPEILGAESPALVQPGNADALATAMVRAVEEPDWLTTAMPSIESFRRRFSAQSMAEAIGQAYIGAHAAPLADRSETTASNIS